MLTREKFFYSKNMKKEYKKDEMNPLWDCYILDRNIFSFKNTISNKLDLINPRNIQLNNENKFYFYVHKMTFQMSIEFPSISKSANFKGGILADEMGLGKTISVLSLIGISNLNHDEHLKINQNETTGGNLIILPTILISQWYQEIKKFFFLKNIHCEIYTGSETNRKKIMNNIEKYEIILTSYGLVRSDFKKNNHLFGIYWKRIICDEATCIHNENSDISKFMTELKSVSKWVLTGTPLQNSVQDLYSFIRFLKYSPWDNINIWKEYIFQKNKSTE